MSRKRKRWWNGISAYRSTIRCTLRFLRNWESTGRKAFVTLDKAAKAIGVETPSLRIDLKNGGELTKDLVIEDNKVFVPSLIEQIRWVPLREAERMFNMSREQLRYYAVAGVIKGEYREFRKCVCIDVKDFIIMSIWLSIRKSISKKQKLSSNYTSVLPYLSIEAMQDLISLLGCDKDA